MLRVLLWPLRKRPAGDAEPPAPSAAACTLSVEEYEAAVPVAEVRDGTATVLYCTPNRTCKARVQSLFSKEPETIDWIRSFRATETMVDVGANVGMYTVWAAKTRGLRVFAFEPESQNYALLCRNVVLNQLQAQVTGYCAALVDREEFSLLHLSGFQPGGSCHTFGEEVDYSLQPHEFEFTQGCVSTTLDNLVGRGVVPVPNHIKIDVDGLEHKVLAGCRATLKERDVKSLLVEINTNLPEHQCIVDEMRALGFRCSDEQVAAALRREGPFKGVGNHVFRR